MRNLGSWIVTPPLELILEAQYFIRQGARREGPYSIAKLHELARRGRFGRAHQVSLDGQVWNRASDIKELFPDVQPHRRPRTAPVGTSGPAEVVSTAASPPAEEVILDVVELVAEEPTSTVSPPEPMWHYTVNAQEALPVPISELQALIQAGQVGPQEQAWTTGMANWREISQLPQFARYVPQQFAANPQVMVVADAGYQIRTDSQSPTARLHQPTAPMAVASLVLGLISFPIAAVSAVFGSLVVCILCVVGSILAVVFGHISLKQIRDSRGELGGRGLALAGLSCGYSLIIVAVVGGIVILVLVVGMARSASEIMPWLD